MTRRIGIYGGSFDPPHSGHLHLALELKEQCSLDEVRFFPTARNPLKERQEEDRTEHRLNMLQLAVSPIPAFTVYKDDIFRPPPCYTVDLVEKVLSSCKKGENFYLLLGSDLLRDFHRWHRFQDLVSAIPLLIGTRDDNTNPEHLQPWPEVYTAVLRGLKRIPRLDISSTNIRMRIASSRYSGHLLPHEVWNYIIKHQLYTERVS